MSVGTYGNISQLAKLHASTSKIHAVNDTLYKLRSQKFFMDVFYYMLKCIQNVYGIFNKQFKTVNKAVFPIFGTTNTIILYQPTQYLFMFLLLISYQNVIYLITVYQVI